MSSLSHSMKIAVLHRRGAYGHDLVEPVARQHEAADMLRQMARESDQLVGGLCRARDQQIERIELPWRISLSYNLLPQLPHTPLASPAVTSSVKPNTLPTSRMALRGR